MTLILDMPCQEDSASSEVENLAIAWQDQPDMEGFEPTEDASVAGPGGDLAKALHFHVDGGHAASPDYIYLNATYQVLLTTTGGSIQWWCKRDSAANLDMVGGANGDPALPAIWFGAADGKLYIRDAASGPANEAEITLTGVDTTEWHHYAITKVAGTLTLFLDGQSFGAFSANTPDEMNFAAFGHDDSAAYSVMDFCGAKIYDANRSQAQIETDYLLGVDSGTVPTIIPSGNGTKLTLGLTL